MKGERVLFGFHAAAARLRQEPSSVREVWVDSSRRDRRMLDFIAAAEAAKVRVLAVERARLDGMAGHGHHQGVALAADPIALARTIDEVLDAVSGPALLLVLDGVTDPHNLGACLRAADGAGAHALIAPKDRACGLNATASKVASGAAESVPYVTVTNLARTLRELRERDILVLGLDEGGSGTVYAANMTQPVALVLGAEGEGLRRLTRETCDSLVHIPMLGSVASLNVSVAAALCLYEAVRQRTAESA